MKRENLSLLREGTVIPAHPLALNSSRKLDERRQRALTRYYMASGAGGIAVGVHTTQFEIRDKDVNLFEPVLRLAAEEVEKANLNRPFIKVAGICGPTEQAVAEAELAASLGYDLGLLSPGGLGDWTESQLIKRAEKVAEVIPVFGFYLQPAVGGRRLSFEFWKDFADIPGVMAVKMAPFNRYQTLDVVRGICHSQRRDEISLYTGNDDNIVVDLLTTYILMVDGQQIEKRIVGGLLGHWAVWTQKAVELLETIKKVREKGEGIPKELLTRGIEITDCNAAFFDAANNFKGCIAGIHEVLRRQGLLEGRYCINPNEELSPGQMEEIDRVYRDYPHLNDDEFVKEHIKEWLEE
jgi:dihydrodipicolinate synthase/N-acetylneuraminate lyase